MNGMCLEMGMRLVVHQGVLVVLQNPRRESPVGNLMVRRADRGLWLGRGGMVVGVGLRRDSSYPVSWDWGYDLEGHWELEGDRSGEELETTTVTDGWIHLLMTVLLISVEHYRNHLVLLPQTVAAAC